MITKYGYNTLGVILIICFVLIAGGIFSDKMILKIALIGVAMFLLVFSLNFFRDPERTAPGSTEKIISPADGKIIVIKEVEETRFIKGKGIQISVFMSPLNVHVNRIPIDGTVDYLEYAPGKYHAAWEDKASTDNERFYTGITSPNGKILFTQIAGFIARRIVNELNMKDTVKQGERFGMIKFGSRVDIIAPRDFVVNVKNGDLVSAGETVLFTLKKN